MQSKWQFEAVHHMLYYIWGSNELFGGIPVVFGGDFTQILPVMKGANQVQIVDKNLQKSFIWPKLQYLFLHENKHIQPSETNEQFSRYLQSLSYCLELHSQITLLDFIAQYDNLI